MRDPNPHQQREASMQKLCVFVIAYVVLSALSMHAAQAKNVVVGVNVVGVDQLSEQQQDALIEQLARNGVKTIRMGLVNQKYARFIARASERGINTVAIVYPTQGSSGAHMRPADPSLGLPWRVEALSDADPEGFRKWFMPQLATLEAVGVRLAAFELGNEINTPNYNGDFPAQATGRILGLSDLNNSNDPEARAIAAGYRAYLKVMAALKDLRDRSQLNR